MREDKSYPFFFCTVRAFSCEHRRRRAARLRLKDTHERVRERERGDDAKRRNSGEMNESSGHELAYELLSRTCESAKSESNYLISCVKCNAASGLYCARRRRRAVSSLSLHWLHNWPSNRIIAHHSDRRHRLSSSHFSSLVSLLVSSCVSRRKRRLWWVWILICARTHNSSLLNDRSFSYSDMRCYTS